MVSIKYLLMASFCANALSAPSQPLKALDVTAPAPREVKAFDVSLPERRSTSLSEAEASSLEARARVTRGTFSLQWIVHLTAAKDIILNAVVTYVEGQVFARSGTGVYPSPFAGVGNGEGVFRVSYLSEDGKFTAVMRILFDTVKGTIVKLADEGVNYHDEEVKSNVEGSFKIG